MYKKRDDFGVSEILGTVILLGIAVIVLAIIYLQVLANPAPNENVNVDIVGMSENNCIVLEHRWGEELSLDTEICIMINGSLKTLTVGDYLNDNSKEDGVWSLGEKMVYQLQYETIDVDNKPQANIMGINRDSNVLIMTGIIDIDVVCDLGLVMKVDEAPTVLGETLFFNLTLTNYGNINIQGVEIEFLLPEQLVHNSNITTNGTYKNSTGIWKVLDILKPGQSIILTIIATVVQLELVEPTQVVLILDGSGTTTPDDWALVLDKMATCIQNQSTFPQNDAIEFTFVQFGGDPGFAKQEIGPVIINGANYKMVSDDILNITQIGGRTPTACGIYLAADLLANSGFFDSSKKQIVILISNGNPTDCCKDDGDYNEDTCAGSTGPKDASFNAKNYLVNKLQMTNDQDQFNAIGVGHSSPKFRKWLAETVWPGPGYYAPPFQEENLQGWVCQVKDWQEFVDIFDDMFGHAFSKIPVYVRISSQNYTDPKMANNFCTILVY